jgi:stress response protein YsnF
VSADAERAIPVVEETAVVAKETATVGRVRVTTHTRQIEELAAATLEGQAVDVVRVPVGRLVEGDPPQIRTEGETTIVPVFEEALVVEKRLMLKEELHIRRRPTQERVEVPVPLRKQEAVVERIDE